MDQSKKRQHFLLLSPLLVLNIIYVSLAGIFTPGFYSKETPNWQAQSIGQDIIDLVLMAPILSISAFLAYRGNKTALFVWAGTNLYLVYTFCLYSFDLHFNRSFMIYCVNLGLAFYSFILFLHNQIRQPILEEISKKTLIKTIGIFFIVIAVMFYGLWLAEILPAVFTNTIPSSLDETGLLTNGVHVLDLSIVLPGIFITGILLIRKKKTGFILAPVLLTFMFLMNLTIGGLIYIMHQRGLEVDFTIAGIMAVLALFTFILFTRYVKVEKLSG